MADAQCNDAVTLPDTDRHRDQYKMGCIELCGAVHTAPRQTSSQIPIGHCSDCIGLGLGVCVGQCEHKRTLTKALCTDLIELIDQTDPFVGEHQCPGLERPLPGHRVPLHVRRQTHSRRALSRRENDAGTSLLDIL